MEEIRPNSSIVESNNTRSFERIDVALKKEQELGSVMFEGKNIHSSPVDGKLLCSYSEKLCKQRRLNGYAFCIRHVLEDKNAPFKQCQYVAKYNGQQCTNPIPFSEDRIYCNSHLQVLGIVPKKNRRKKASETVGVDADSTRSSAVQLQFRADVSSALASTNMAFISQTVLPRRHKRLKTSAPRKQLEIPAINELRKCQKRLHENQQDLFKFYGIDTDSSESSDSEGLPWQQIWLPPDSDHENDLGIDKDSAESINHAKLESDSRTGKISRLSSRLRRELHQLRRTLRAHRYRQPHFISTATALLKAAQTNVSASVDSILENRRISRFSPLSCIVKMCAFSSNEAPCKKSALPYTKFCSNHIMNDSQQVLYAQCTAKWPGGLQCSVPVFDLVHERALCEEHARKKAKFQEAQAAAASVLKSTTAVNKQQPKKSRRKPQLKAVPNMKPTNKHPKKTSTRKPASRSSKSKATKTIGQLQVRDVSPLSNSFSPSDTAVVFSPSIDMQMSSDFSQTSEPSPVSPQLEDLQQFESSLFETQQQDHLLLPGMDDENLCADLTAESNGVSPNEKLFQALVNKQCPGREADKWDATPSIPASVISPTVSHAKTSSPLNSNRLIISVSKGEVKLKPSPLNSRSKRDMVSKPKRTSKSKSVQSAREILSPTLHHHNSLSNGAKRITNHLTLINDPMFSPPDAMLGGSELKSHGNGLPTEHLPRMDSVLSPPQRTWSGVVNSTGGNSYTSPLNSQTSESRMASPPFSPPPISPHASPGNVFTFERHSHYQQTSVLSPTLSPASPSFLHSTSLKQSVSYPRRAVLDPSGVDDPFLMPVDQEQPMLGAHFHQNSDSALGDLRLR